MIDAGGSTSDVCLNCGASMVGPYCASCGQKKPHENLTLGELLSETTEELTHWDGKVPATLKALFFKPGLLTSDFLSGRRARWLAPLRLYLICRVAFFLVDPVVESVTHREHREIAQITVTNSDGTASLKPEARGDIDQSGLAKLIGQERLEKVAANAPLLNHTVAAAYLKAMFILLPLFALLTSWAWHAKAPRYPAHLYISLHLHAAWFGVFAVAKLLSGIISSETVDIIIGVAAMTYAVWYGLVAFRRVFGDSWGKTIAKAAVIAPVYGVAFRGGEFRVAGLCGGSDVVNPGLD